MAVAATFEKAMRHATSMGLEATFKKALRFRKDETIALVLLDEVGLCETSPYNPLKVLHAPLEPSDPKCAVVGISNWALDAAKMNRAILLTRPDPTLTDLAETAESLQEVVVRETDEQAAADDAAADQCDHAVVERKRALAARVEERRDELRDKLTLPADAYRKDDATQAIPSSHGLRDFYALVKTFGRATLVAAQQAYALHLAAPVDKKKAACQVLVNGLCRNFGGQPDQLLLLLVGGFFQHGRT